MNRMRPARWLAVRRAARRRGSEPIPTEALNPGREPLPPLVSPDDDREFVQQQPTPALDLKTAC